MQATRIRRVYSSCLSFTREWQGQLCPFQRIFHSIQLPCTTLSHTCKFKACLSWNLTSSYSQDGPKVIENVDWGQLRYQNIRSRDKGTGPNENICLPADTLTNRRFTLTTAETQKLIHIQSNPVESMEHKRSRKVNLTQEINPDLSTHRVNLQTWVTAENWESAKTLIPMFSIPPIGLLNLGTDEINDWFRGKATTEENTIRTQQTESGKKGNSCIRPPIQLRNYVKLPILIDRSKPTLSLIHTLLRAKKPIKQQGANPELHNPTKCNPLLHLSLPIPPQSETPPPTSHPKNSQSNLPRPTPQNTTHVPNPITSNPSLQSRAERKVFLTVVSGRSNECEWMKERQMEEGIRTNMLKRGGSEGFVGRGEGDERRLRVGEKDIAAIASISIRRTVRVLRYSSVLACFQCVRSYCVYVCVSVCLPYLSTVECLTCIAYLPRLVLPISILYTFCQAGVLCSMLLDIIIYFWGQFLTF